MKELALTVRSLDGEQPLLARIDQLVIGGWTGRDKAAMEHHMVELEALGIKRPSKAPLYYRVAASRLTQEPTVEDVGANSSGEVETVLIASGGRLYVGTGSDHTDRQVEAYGVNVSKHLCDKPIAATVWPYEEVAPHWDQLILRSDIIANGKRIRYQEGPASGLLAPGDLMRGYCGSDRLADGTALFGGTMPALGGIKMASRFEGELEDPVLGRSIRFGYDIAVLPINE